LDSNRFDNLTRLFGAGLDRRQVIRGLLGGAGALAGLSALRPENTGAQACRAPGEVCQLNPGGGNECCPGLTCDDPGAGNGHCSDCPQGQTFCAATGACINAGACCTDDDCDAEPCQACEGGQCVTTGEYCAAGDYCYNTGTGGCCTDEECGDGVCVDRTCQECPEGQLICPATGRCFDPFTTCCTDIDCIAEPCRACVSGDCVTTGEYCESGDYCYSKMTGGCCTSDECGNEFCVNRECQPCPSDELFCEGTQTCYNPEHECCIDDDCEGCAVCNDANQCADPECCHDSDCGSCEFCDDGVCHGACSQSESCCNGECVADEIGCCREFGDFCGLTDVAAAGGALQLDCCDGLLCCRVDDDHVCAECCSDHDCPKDAFCHHGFCEFPHACKSDVECPKGTCCCKDGNCSRKCCNKPPKPPTPTPPAPVTVLPATGAKDGESDSSSAVGITLAAGAAALLGAKILRQNSEEAGEDA
jgi:hypothetical protein